MFILETVKEAAVTGDVCHGMGNIVLIVKFVLMIIQWVVPIVLIVLGTIDLVKAVIAGKEEDIKKNQTALIKRVIAAVIVFLVPLIVSILMGWLGNKDWRACWNDKKNTGDISNLFDFDNFK